MYSSTTLSEILSNGTDEFDLSLFENLPLSLQFKILTTGKILHTTKDLSQLKRITMNQWFDFRPIINRLYQSRGYPQIKIYDNQEISASKTAAL